jgi:plasmid stabilization system protein ParE
VAALKWSPAALDDLARLLDFLHARSPDAALRAARTISATARVLTSMPEAGRPMEDGTGRRELVIPFAASAYMLRYRIDVYGDAVVIRAWHGREQRR